VVQWVERRVQDILTGKFHPYKRSDFGHWITDGELEKLRAAGRVEHYTQRYVWMYPLPEAGRFGGQLETLKGSSHRVRAFYITTSMPESQLENVRPILPKLNTAHVLRAKAHDGHVAIYGTDDNPFTSLQDAESVLQELVSVAPDMFYGASVAVYELALGRTARPAADDEPEMNLSLETVLQALSDTHVTAGKHVVIVGEQHQQQKDEIEQMLVEEMEMTVSRCTTAREAVPILEDEQPALLLVDLELPDLHGWAFIRNVREIRSLRDMKIIVVSDNPSDEVFALKVAKVAGFMARPLRMRKLREKIWLALREDTEDVEEENADDDADESQ